MIELLYVMEGNGPTLTTIATAAAADLVPPVLIPAGMARQGGMLRARLMGKTSTVIAVPGTATFCVFIGAMRWSPSHIYKIGDRVTSDANKTYTCMGPPYWQPNTAYTAVLPDMVKCNGRVYVCAVAGTSGNAGGPSGIGAGIVDGTGTLRWDYQAPGTAGLSDPTTPPAGAADINDLCCQWDYTAAAAPFATSEAIVLEDVAAKTDVPWLMQLDMVVKAATILVMGTYHAYNLEATVASWGVSRLIPAATPAAVAFNPEINNWLRIVYTPSVDTASMTCMMYSVEGMTPMAMYGW